MYLATINAPDAVWWPDLDRDAGTHLLVPDADRIGRQFTRLKSRLDGLRRVASAI